MSDSPAYRFDDPTLAQAYDAVLAPRICEPWIDALLEAGKVALGDAVLDVAAGTGLFARRAAAHVGRKGRIVAADASRAMLEVAAAKRPAEDGAPIDYVHSPAAPLAVSDAGFDVAVCQQGLQFFPDRPAALREMRRALRPGGRVVVSVWGPFEECTLYPALHAIARELLPIEVADLLRVPFCLPELGTLEQLLRKSGFGEVRGWRDSRDLVFAGGIAQAIGSIGATPLGSYVASLPDSARLRLVAAAERHLSLLGSGGAVRGPMLANIAVGRK